ncbi:MAG: DUF58 domain-containing protein [Weeksellaceae bacterium]
MKSWLNLFLTKVFFYAFALVIVSYLFGFYFPVMLLVAPALLFAVVLLSMIDWVLLFIVRNPISGHRKVKDKLSNADKNPVQILIQNHYPFRVHYTILDEVPAQFQLFDFKIKGFLSSKSEVVLDYTLTPTERGRYQFGKTNVFVSSPLGFFERKIVLHTEGYIKVYPSFLRLKQFSLQNFKAHINEIGQKKVRKLGHSMEFEQIKNYVAGDDIRTINWKATAKSQKLMVNQYIDEKSQQIYCVIDTGRVMKMPFNGLSLLDYAVNASLVISNVVLQNQDRSGIFTFSKAIKNLVKAERRTNQLQKISESLYSVETDYMESDFGILYNATKHKVTQRSLLLLFTNFESMDSMHRQLPYLLGINRSHLLVVVFFQNTELEDFINNSNTELDAYEKTLVEKFIYEKHQIVLELNNYGIQTVLTRPEDLTINTLNKYLEIKSRGIL